MKFTVNILLNCILYCDTGHGCDKICLQARQTLIMDIIFVAAHSSEMPQLYFEKTVRLSRYILMLLAAIQKKFSSRNCRLRKSFSTLIMLSTNLCHFSIGFLHDGQQNGNMERREFVEFNRRKWNKCSRFLSIFCRSSVMLVLISVLTQYLLPFPAPLLRRIQVSS